MLQIDKPRRDMANGAEVEELPDSDDDEEEPKHAGGKTSSSARAGR
jgi:hypothetical protein